MKERITKQKSIEVGKSSLSKRITKSNQD